MDDIQLIQGDCMEAMLGLPDNCVDLILADIPYGEVNQKSSGLRTLDRGNADRIDFDIDNMAKECVRLSTGSIYVFCGIGQISGIDKAFRDFGMTTRLCVWEKTNPSPMNGDRLWLSGLEFCIFTRHPKATFNRHCKKALWKYPSGHSKTHPTQKPLKLFEHIIESSTDEGDRVLDFTMGSGTTGVACKRLGRKFIGIEREEDYFELAEKRIFETQDTIVGLF